MKKNFVNKSIQLLGLILVLNHANAAETRDNYFCDTNNSHLSFNPVNDDDWYSITDGQPFDKAINNVLGRPNCLNIRAGRHNSTKNVEWVKEKLGILNVPWNEDFATATSYMFDFLPHGLNFAIMGTLTYTRSGVTAICENVIIAQGHLGSGPANNFWLFNNATDYIHALKCFDSQSQKSIYLKIKSTNDPSGNEYFDLSTFD